MPVDYAGNSLSSAKAIPLTSTVQTQSDWVGMSDTNDFYKFTLSSYSRLSLKYYGTSAAIGLQVIQDKNGNSAIDTGDVLQSTTLNANYSGTSNQELTAGTYYLRVFPGSSTAETNYKVDLSAQAVNAVPRSLQYSLQATTLNWNNSLSISGGAVYDGNGFADLARVDFKIKRADGTFIDVADAVSFSPYATDPNFGIFNYTLDLSPYKLTGGSYTLWSQAYDKGGLASAIVEKAFTINSNATPTLQFTIDQATIQTNDNQLILKSGLVTDSNGGTDVARVDFKVRRSDGSLVNLSSATGFTTTGNQASFTYTADLSSLGLGAGSYKLVGQAFDRFGAGSTLIEQAFSLVAPAANDAGNTLKTSALVNSAVFTRSDNVSAIDRSDLYKFTVSQSGVFTANLSALSADADVRLIQDQNNNGVIDQGEVLAWQWERGSGAENIRKFVTAGTYFLEVMSYNKQSTSYAVTSNFVASATDTQKFSIGINFLSTASVLTQSLKDAVLQAAKFWENVISYSPTASPYVLTIDVGGQDLAWSSSGGTLANAGPSNISVDSTGKWKLPTKGKATINTNSGAIASLTSSIEYFTRVLIHEFGHVLGLGTYWDSQSGRNFVDIPTATYKANTYAGWAYGELKGTYVQTAIPLTTGVGAGSDYAHWKEEIFKGEIMTHLANKDIKMPLSQMTIASLRDIGWSVNYGAAEAYLLTV